MRGCKRTLYTAFEHYAVQLHRRMGGAAWHWSECSFELLMEAGYVHRSNQVRLLREFHKCDFGFDAMAYHHGVYHGVQTKFYTARQLKSADIATSLLMLNVLQRHDPRSKLYLHVLTETRIQTDLRESIERSLSIELVKTPRHEVEHYNDQ